jgi:hypothetical protein
MRMIAQLWLAAALVACGGRTESTAPDSGGFKETVSDGAATPTDLGQKPTETVSDGANDQGTLVPTDASISPAEAAPPPNWRFVYGADCGADAPEIGDPRVAVYDAARREIVVFPYAEAPAAWDGSHWRRLPPPPDPEHLWTERMVAYDSARERIVAYQGCITDPERWCENDESAAWDGFAWSELHLTTQPHLVSGAMAYDQARDRLVMSARGRLETWEYDGADWTRRSPATAPATIQMRAMVYDEARRRVLLFDGGKPEIWAWDGADWTIVSPHLGAPAVDFPAFAYDSARAIAVLFGGPNTAPGQTWEWDGTSWFERFPATSPFPRYAAMAFDGARGEIVAILGTGGTPYPVPTETWQYP